jgi:hypothetical protein
MGNILRDNAVNIDHFFRYLHDDAAKIVLQPATRHAELPGA